MKIRTAKLYSNPLENLLVPPPEKCNCFILSIDEEEFEAVVEFTKMGNFHFRILSGNELAIFSKKEKNNLSDD